MMKRLPLQTYSEDSKAGCAAARAQATGAGMKRRHLGRIRDQPGDNRETSSLEAAEGGYAGQQAGESCTASKYAHLKVWDAADERFFEKHVQGLEEEFFQRDQRGLFQRLESLNMED